MIEVASARSRLNGFIGAIFLASIAALLLSSLPANARKYVKFDVPGAQDTIAYAINNANVAAGGWFDAAGNKHGFVRAADRTIATFDPANPSIPRSPASMTMAGLSVTMRMPDETVTDSCAPRTAQ